ncbi:MAG: DUF488 domain-containing protein [Gemmatimonadaceae bacterium]
MKEVATIGYEGTTMQEFLQTLRSAKIELVVDVRAVASSRRPGFAKTRLAAHLAEVGIAYEHIRSLGTPANGRAAARAGRHDEMRAIFEENLKGETAQGGLDRLEAIIQLSQKIALLCFEHDPKHCHRTMVAAALGGRRRIKVVHLLPAPD